MPNALQVTPGTNRNTFVSPVTRTNAIPIQMAVGQSNNQSTNWDRHQPYPKMMEGKAAYEVALQAWWDRNGFNGRVMAANFP